MRSATGTSEISGLVAPASSREMSRRAPRISSTASSETSTLRARSARSSRPIWDGAFAERTGVEPGGVERLQNVVARRGEKARLREVRFLRDGLRARQFGVEALEFGGALVDPLFQKLVGGLQRLLGLNGLRHVGIGGDDAPVGQPRRPDLDHPMGREEPEPRRLIFVQERRHPFGDEVLRIARPIDAARGVEAHDLVEPDAMAQHGGGQIEEVDELAVPGGEREVGVENGDALAGVVERMLQLIAARLDRRRGLVDEFQRRLAGDGARPQEQRQHLARGRSADGGRQQEFRMADELRARLLRRVVFEAALPQKGRKGAARPRRAEIAGDRRLEFARGGRRAPQAEGLGLAADPGEGARLRAFERARLAGERKGDERDDIGDERQDDAADQRVRGEGHESGRAQPGDGQRPVNEKGGDRPLRLDRWQKQQIDPAEGAGDHSGDGAARGAAPPEKPAKKGRGDLRDGGEGEKPDRGEPRLAGDPLIGEAEREDGDDRETANPQNERANVAFGRLLRHSPPQQERHHEVVRNGDRQGEAVEHHHRGRRRNAADHRQERDAARAGGERQREDGQIAVDRAVRKRLEARDSERRDEQVDENEIGGEKPGGRADAALVVVLDHGDVELARQQDDGEGRKQRGDAPDRRIGRRLDDRADVRVRQGGLGQIADPAVEPPDDEGADREKRRELDDRFHRDGEDEAVLVLLRIDPPRSEGDGEGGEHQRDRERERSRGRARRQPRLVEGGDDCHQRGRGSLELQRDIRRRAGQSDEGGGRRDGLRLAVARRHEVGDRGQVLRPGEIGDAPDEGRAEADDQHRADVDRQEIEPVLGGEPDRTVIGPGRAIDGEAQGVDDSAPTARDKAPAASIAPTGDEEQEDDVADRGEKDRRAVH